MKNEIQGIAAIFDITDEAWKMDCMKPLDHITADDVIRSGACVEGVVEWLRRNDNLSASMFASALLRNTDDVSKIYIKMAARLNGNGYGNGYGYSNGSGDGYGNVYGYRCGTFDGYGDGYGSGYGYSYGFGNGYCYDSGYGYGDGDGYGYGEVDGDGYGYGSGYGDGDGNGYSYCRSDEQ